MILQERIHLLQSMPFFGAINDNSIKLILELSETILVPSGEYFFREGGIGDALFIIEQGRVVIFKQSGDKEFILRHAQAGDCFGELALIDLTPRSASVRAETYCTTIKTPYTALHQLYQKDSEQFLLIQMNMAREVSRRLLAADDRCFELQIGNHKN